MSRPVLSMRGTLCWPPSRPHDRSHSPKPLAAHLPDFRSRHAQVAAAVGPVVLVQAAQRPIQLGCKPRQVGGDLGEFHQVAVPSRLPRVFGEDRPDVEVGHGGGRRVGGFGDGAFHLFTDQVLAERRQEVARPAREAQQRRMPFLEANRVSHQVAPQTGAGSQHHGILHTRLHLGGSVARRPIPTQLLHGHKLEKNAVIGDQPQQVDAADPPWPRTPRSRDTSPGSGRPRCRSRAGTVCGRDRTWCRRGPPAAASARCRRCGPGR